VSQELFLELHKEIMKLNQSDMPCDCEKDTDSDSGQRDCTHGEDIFKWLKNNEDNFDIFDVDIDQVQECFTTNKQKCAMNNSEQTEASQNKLITKEMEEEKTPDDTADDLLFDLDQDKK